MTIMSRTILLLLIAAMGATQIIGCASSSEKSAAPVAKKTPAKKVQAEPEPEPEPAPPAAKEEKYSHSALGDALEAKNDEQVKKIAGGILAKNSNDIKALNVLAMTFFKNGKPELAKIYLSRALKVNEKSAETLANLGVIQWSQGKMRDAYRSFRKAMQSNSSDPHVAANLGQIYAEAKDYRRAKAALEIAYDKDVRPLSVLQAYAVALHAEGKTGKAEDIFEEAIKLAPSDPKLLANYAIFLVEGKKDYQEAESVLGKIRFLGVLPEQRTLIESLETKVRGGKK